MINLLGGAGIQTPREKSAHKVNRKEMQGANHGQFPVGRKGKTASEVEHVVVFLHSEKSKQDRRNKDGM